jgi:hypothetical protein
MRSKNDLFGLRVAIAGWGVKRNGDVPNILETVDLNILLDEDCQNRILKLHGQTINIHSNCFCTAAEPYALLSQVSIYIYIYIYIMYPI